MIGNKRRDMMHPPGDDVNDGDWIAPKRFPASTGTIYGFG
jgi:hypothetical protein